MRIFTEILQYVPSWLFTSQNKQTGDFYDYFEGKSVYLEGYSFLGVEDISQAFNISCHVKLFLVNSFNK